MEAVNKPAAGKRRVLRSSSGLAEVVCLLTGPVKRQFTELKDVVPRCLWEACVESGFHQGPTKFLPGVRYEDGYLSYFWIFNI